jgi:hypothetical protein
MRTVNDYQNELTAMNLFGRHEALRERRRQAEDKIRRLQAAIRSPDHWKIIVDANGETDVIPIVEAVQ